MENLDPFQIEPGLQRRLRVDEYHRMTEAGIFDPDERVELLEGALITMTPQGGRHGRVVQWLNGVLVRGAGEQYAVRVQLPLTLGDDSEPEPEFAVVPAGEPKDPDEHPRWALLVVEVAWSSLRIDRLVKAGIYARANIPDYWLVNLKESCVEVFRDPDASAGRFRTMTTAVPGEMLKPLRLPGPEIPVADLFR